MTLMEETLRSLILRVQQVSQNSPERQQAIIELVTQLLKARRVSRPPKGQPLTGIYLELFQAVQRDFQQAVEQEIGQFKLGRDSAREWAEELRQKDLEALLTDDRLQQLALAAQACQPKTGAWQFTSIPLRA